MNDKYISASYIKEKLWYIKQLITIIDESDSDNIGDQISEDFKYHIAESMATIAKELGVKISS